METASATPSASEFDLDILISDTGWETALPNIEPLCLRACGAIRSVLEAPGSGEMCISLVDNAAIQALNAQYRGKDVPTNVLSFPADNVNPVLGDIVLALGVCQSEAKAGSRALSHHICHLVIHGYLHLLGYDHAKDAEANIMEALEILALKQLGIANPYVEYHA